ncbi:MAG: hypothetical protein M3Y08_05965 [Fibrobacterota bacterium]|nr:hypothetical protein [Fibrobacterota bacterium]
MKPLRVEFADTMKEVGEIDEKLVVMVGDISHGILQTFAKACPGRYFNVGICEPTIVTMAAGVAKSGLIPVIHTIAPFIIERSYEQIKLDFGYQNHSGTFISVGSAFDYAQLGCSHHCYTDLSIMSHFKRAKVFFPASPLEFNKLFKSVYDKDGINYFRLTEHPHGVDFNPDDIEVGKGITVRIGGDATIVAVGPQLRTAISAAALLADKGVQVEVLYFHTIKPFDADLVRKSVEKTRRVLSIEEASEHGGVYERVLRATTGIDGARHVQMAIDDFIHGYGTHQELCEKIGFTPQGIVNRMNKTFDLGI